MIVYIKEDHQDLWRIAADIIELQIKQKPACVLGLATGSSPIGLYNELINKYNKGLSFKHITSFNLDEYMGIPSDNINSYSYFMKVHLFNHIDILNENTYIPGGMATNCEKECQRYENLIMEKGGIDLQILGLGQNGHIGFNEPDLEFANQTHIVKLDLSTREANARFFGNIDDVPTEAITMGIKTIMKAKRILLIATGKNKAKAVKAMIEGNIRSSLPASVLQLHQEVIILLDNDAAADLEGNYNS